MTSTTNNIVALALKHGASSYRNRADTQNPAYGFTETALAAFAQELLAGQCLHQIAEPAALTEQDAGLLAQGIELLEGLAADERRRGNDPAAEGAACSAHAVQRLAAALLSAQRAAPQAAQAAVPTDADIDAALLAFDWDGWIDQAKAKRAFTREALARWAGPAPSIPQWIDDPHDIEQGQMLNPEWVKLQQLEAPAHPAEGVPALDLESLAMPQNPHSAAAEPAQHIAWAQGAGAVFATVEAALAATPAAPGDPMDWPLPCDVTVGHGTMRKGVALRTLVLRMKGLYEMATGHNADEVEARTPEQRAQLLAEFQAQIGAIPVAPAAPAADARDVQRFERDAEFEAVRKKFCKLQRYSFLLDDKGNVRRAPDYCGNWVEFEAAHTLFDPASVDSAIDAARAAQGGV
ncbi:MAG: hypothetical protein LBJ15_19305 [Comamonas sp.]|jgi:hypothetical protein|uniref:hypothetical protein n=1 Tax=Comamonas sp. TaxID=34028 RepID=UPI00283702EB|nr:hypothetical protein [Comamonas sp.]MDR0216125.1 hypothetical protein [Comamonas sp.]